MHLHNKIGFWEKDKAGLPVFNYTGNLPDQAFLSDGSLAKLPDDPWFILGNYKFTLFMHASGEYELLDGQRSWARLNHAKNPPISFYSPWGKMKDDRHMNFGGNEAKIQIDGETTLLTGFNSVCADSSLSERRFACGYAEFNYRLEDDVKRKISVLPSKNPYDGFSCFLLTLSVKNNGAKSKQYCYEESTLVHYKELQYQMIEDEQHKVKYDYEALFEKNIAGVKITSSSDEPVIPELDEMSRVEYYPPFVFIAKVSEGEGEREGDGAVVYADPHKITYKNDFSLGVGQEKTMQFIVGFSREGT